MPDVLQTLQEVCAKRVTTGRGLNLRFSEGKWKVYVELQVDRIGPTGVSTHLEEACREVLAQLEAKP